MELSEWAEDFVASTEEFSADDGGRFDAADRGGGVSESEDFVVAGIEKGAGGEEVGHVDVGT